VVVSAGNENNAEPSYPAWFAAPSDDLGVICVGAIDYSLSKAPYSNFGPQITVVAPGGNTAVDFNDDGYPDGVLSTSWDQNTNQPTYLYYQGTSMAAPHVTGVVSLLMALNASLSPLQLRTILKETAIDLGAPQRDNLYGDGLIDPVAALARVATNLQLPPKRVVSSAALEFGYVQTQLTASVSNGGGGTLKVDPPTVTMQQGSGWLSAVLSGSLLTVSVSRSGLANGDYSGEIQLTSNGGAATIKVAMKVGSGSAGDVGTVYIIAVDPRTFDTVGQTSIGLAQQYKFTILPIPTGNYLVVGGTDKDKDFIICEKEDYCGLYPVSNQPSEVKVELNKNTTNVNFVLERPVTPTSSWGDLKLRIPAEGLDRLWDEVSPVVLQGILQRMLGGSASR
jgi:serine protease